MLPTRLATATALAALLLSACNQQQAEAPPPDPEPPAAQTEVAETPEAAPESSMVESPEPTAGTASVMALPLFDSAEAYEAFCTETLDAARAQFEGLEAFDGEATIESFYVPANELSLTFLRGISISSLYGNVYPSEAVRTAAETCQQEFTSFWTEVSLSRPMYDAFSAIDASGEDEGTQFSLMKTIRDYKRSGVDKDEATREQIRTLIDEITEIGQEFDRNIREDVGFIEIPPEKLEGLPEDYIAAHPPGENGLVRITTDYPDYIPFMTYAVDDNARKELRIVDRSGAYPENDSVLKNLITKRYELANILDYASYAHYALDDKMISTPERALGFIDEISSTVQAAAARDKEILLERLQQIDPEATEVGVWQYSYLKHLLAEEKYKVDSKLLRTYFPGRQGQARHL